MSTIRQEKLADAMIKNMASDSPANKAELLVSVGYAELTAKKKPGEVMEQKGVQDALVARGFTVENAKRVVSEIMLDENQDANARLKATDQTFKVHGAYAPEKNVNLSLNVDTEGIEDFLEIGKKYDEEMKKKLIE